MSIFGTTIFASGGARGLPSVDSSAFNTNVGDLIIVGVGWSDSGTASVADLAGTVFTPGTIHGAAFSTFFQWFWGIATSADASNVATATFTNPTNNNTIISVRDIPLTGTATFDVDVASSGSNNSTTGTYSTSGSDEYVAVDAYNQFAGGGYTAEAGYTLDSASFGGGFGGAQHNIFGSPQTSITSNFPAGSGGSQAFALAFSGSGGTPSTDEQHSVDAYIITQPDFTHNVDAYIFFLQSFQHSVDCFVVGSSAELEHSVDCDVFIPPQVSLQHSVDADITAQLSKVHSVDCFVTVPIPPPSFQHGVDCFVQQLGVGNFVDLLAGIQFPINPINGYVKLNSTIAAPQRQFVQLAATIIGGNSAFANLLATIVIAPTPSYVKLNAKIIGGGSPSHSVDCVVAGLARQYVQLAALIVQPLSEGFCGNFPGASYVKLAAWIIIAGDSEQAPNSGFTRMDDFLSSQLAVDSYKPISIFTLSGPNLPPGGISLIITAFTAGVVSWQTRTAQWLTREDEAPNGILITNNTSTHVDPTGRKITTTTQVKQIQDVLETIITIVDSGQPGVTNTTITQTNKSGQTTKREISTTNINGNISTIEKKNVYTNPPPSLDNIQPVTVRTLDGIQHFQFFGPVNPEWAGGDQEGLTNTATEISIQPGNLNGETVDQYGNPILQRTTNQTISTPDGKVQNIQTIEVGIRDVGTTTTDTASQFNGIQTTTVTTTTYPDGSQTVSTVVENQLTGDSLSTTVETNTNEVGQVTVRTTIIEEKTFEDPSTGQIQTQTTTSVKTVIDGVTTIDTTTSTTDNFEDDIINQKIKVFFVQELTINCVIDWQSMGALSEINITNQRSYALQELFGQMLGNANLSYALRQNLIQQYQQAQGCMTPMQLQAVGKTYQVVFAPSASAFRAKYIPGAEPAVFELQMILQERSNLIDGTRGN